MGFFDLLNPAFDAVDGFLAGFAAQPVRLIFWAFVGSLVTMLLYQRLSRQDQMGQLKGELRQAQRALSNFDGEFDELRPLIARTLGLSMKQLGLSLGPAVLASLPLIFLLAWAATRFAANAPDPGDPVQVTLQPPTAEAHWSPPTAAEMLDPGVWRVDWPGPGETLELSSGDEELVSLPTPQPTPIVHKKQWWNALFANPGGYLPPEAPLKAVEIGLPSASYLPFGPDWVRSWLTAFLLALFAFSLLLKIVLKIH
ncbi:MAG: hypothetical protein R3200_07655 [Xanthomonadales bacterium]|nr:hypothetical protein [Xanthomonadales bacterium]